MSDNFRLIEGDGIITNLFYFLWKKKTDTGTLQAPPNAPEGSVPMPWERDGGDAKGANQPVHFSPEFMLPSTVMYEHNYPKAWYYPHANGKGVWDLERKLGKDIDSASILKNFCPRSAAALEQLRVDEYNTTSNSGNPSGGGAGSAAPTAGGGGGTAAGILPAHLAKFEEQDLVAAYFSTAKAAHASPPRGGPSARGGSTPIDDVDEPRTVVEYMNEPQLRDFLLRRTKRDDGFLQRWVWPNGKHNNVLQAVWTPHMCLVTRRTNTHAVRDAREAMYDRAVTFEGPSHLSTESSVAAHIEWQIGRFCNDLVAYMYTEHHVPLRRMVVHFKVDWNSHIWFLWASSVRVQDKAQLNLTVRYVARLDVGGLTGGDDGGGEQAGGGGTGGGGGRRGQRNARAKFIAQQPPEMKKLIRQVDGERHLTQIHFPRPPSMGPIGDMYTWGSLMEPLHASTPQRKKKKKKGKRHATTTSAGDNDRSAPASVRASPRGSVQSSKAPTHDGRSPFTPRKSHPLAHQLQPLALPAPPNGMEETSPAPSSNANRRPSSAKRRKSHRRKSHRGGSPHSPSNAQRMPRFDDMLRTLKSSNRLYTTEQQRLRDAHSDVGAARHGLDEAAAALFGPHRRRRHATVLWAMLRHVVCTGILRAHMALTDAMEFMNLTRYSVYSHFLTSEQPLMLPVPLTLGCGVPNRDGAWIALATTLATVGGLEIQEVFGEATSDAGPLPMTAPLVPTRPTSSRRRQSSVPRCSLPSVDAALAEDAHGGSDHGVPVTAGGSASEGLPPPSAIASGSPVEVPQPASPGDQRPRTVGAKPTRSRSCVVLPGSGVLGDDGGAASLAANASPLRHSYSASFATPPASAASSDALAAKPARKRARQHTTALRVVAAHKPVADVDTVLGTHTNAEIGPPAAASAWRLLAWRWVFFRRPEPEAFVFGSLGASREDVAHGEEAVVEPPPDAPVEDVLGDALEHVVPVA